MAIASWGRSSVGEHLVCIQRVRGSSPLVSTHLTVVLVIRRRHNQRSGESSCVCLCAGGLVTIAEGTHPFPSRTRSLSPPAPTILQGQPCGTIGRCRLSPPASTADRAIQRSTLPIHLALFARCLDVRGGLVTTAEGAHPFPSRTRSLSPPAPTILQGQPCGTIGRCRSPRPPRRRTRPEATRFGPFVILCSRCPTELRWTLSCDGLPAFMPGVILTS